jgi:hypothetical protein
MANELTSGKFQLITSLLGKGSIFDKDFSGKKVGLFSKIFGCRHQNISRPFSNGKIGYRVCLMCGARKRFNAETLETFGSFYFAPVEKPDLKIGI